MRLKRLKLHRNYRSDHGYSLIELLAVTSIIVIVSGLIAGVLSSTLRGGNKSRVTNEVSQNGNYALSVISNTALLAQDVTKMDGVAIADCTESPPMPASSIEFEQLDGSLVEFACDAQATSIASKSGSMTTYLIDNSSVKADPASCSFICQQIDGNPYSLPIITISFTVSENLGSRGMENTSSSVFKTSVTMRNYSPR